MSYLARLKQKISADSAELGATKPSKPSFVPFVAPLPEHSRQIQSANDPRPSIREIFLSDNWRYGSAESVQEIARQLDARLWLERCEALELDGGHTRADAELIAALDVIQAKGH